MACFDESILPLIVKTMHANEEHMQQHIWQA